MAARPPAIALRRAGAADIAALWALRTRAVRSGCAAHYPARTVELWSATPVPPAYAGLVAAGGAVLAESARGLLGYAILERGGGEVDAVFVDPDCAGLGVGKLLLRALEEMAGADGTGRLHLYASLNAVAFYRAAGFVALRAARYPHPSGVELDCVYMEKTLAPE